MSVGAKRLLFGAITFSAAAAFWFHAPRSVSREAAPPAADPSSVLERGQSLYQQNCAGCHGPEGRGDGPAAAYLFPKPRDFGRGKFRITSGRSGDLPTEQDLFRIVTDGMPGSAMPSWELLPETDRWALVKYVKTLVRFHDEDEEQWVNLYDLRGEPKPVDIGNPPAPTAERIAHGKIVYQKGECWKCHGPQGHGDGPSAGEQRDENGYPLPPRDFSEGVFKGGRRPEDLFRRVSFGIGPMPAHEGTLTADERWDVVYYVLSLVKPEAQRMAEQKRKTIVARRVNGDIPHDPDSPFWTARQPTYLALMPLWWRKDRVEGLLVSAAHNGKEIALRVAWVDTSRNAQTARPQEFRDGVAVQFAKSQDAPFIAMGADREKVNIWFWKSDRQEALAPNDVAAAYPNYVVDDYPSLAAWKPGEGFVAKDQPIEAHDPRFMTAWGAGNIVAAHDGGSPVENLSASGFSTLASQGRVAQTVGGLGVWNKGTWSVVMWRTLQTANPEDVTLAPGTRIPAAFAVWDGANGDRNGQKSITIWHDLEVEW